MHHAHDALAEPAAQRSDRSLRRSSGETPLLGVPSLADPSAEASDGRTLRFLLMTFLAQTKKEDQERRKVEEQEKQKTMTEEEEEEPEGWREAYDSDGDLYNWHLRTRRVTWTPPPSSSSAGKRRKRSEGLLKPLHTRLVAALIVDFGGGKFLAGFVVSFPRCVPFVRWHT